MRQRGHYQKRGNTWTAYYYVPGGRTKKLKSKGGFKTKGDAVRFVDQILGEIRDGSYQEPTDIAFSDFADEWLQSRISIMGSTFENYESYLRAHVKPVIGSLKLTDIRLETIERLVADLTKKKIGKDRTLSPNTIGKIIVMTRMIFKAAIRKKYIRFNPAQDAELPKVIKKRIQLPSKEDVLKVLEEATPEQKTLFLVDAMTGLRRGEILALQWPDIDWLSEELIVQRAICKFKSSDGVRKITYGIGPPKSGKPRRVALPATVYQALRNLQHCSALQGPDAFVFSRNGTFISPEYFTKSMALPLLKKATDGRVKRFHDLRHFFVSMLIDQGESPKYIQDQVGHASIRMTMDTYGHLMPQAKKEAAAKLEKSLFGEKENSPISSPLAGMEDHNKQDRVN